MLEVNFCIAKPVQTESWLNDNGPLFKFTDPENKLKFTSKGGHKSDGKENYRKRP